MPVHRAAQEGRPSYRPIQRFNNKRTLQLVSNLDETTINVAQELSDQELYNYDVLVKLLSDRFDPASRVSASRSRFYGRMRRHHEDTDAYVDSITELC